MTYCFPLFTLKRLFLIFFVFLAFSPSHLFANSPLKEDEAKAALIYNFIKHTTWPNEKQKTHITIHFLGDNESLFKVFSTIADEARVRNKTLKVQHIQEFDPNARQDILVISADKNPIAKNIIPALNNSHTLIISDQLSDKKLVMINFTKPNNDLLGFEINKANIIYERLAITNDVLLNGGTEIEVATLYKELERSVFQLKNDTQHTRHLLSEKTLELDKKNNEIHSLKIQIDSTNKELAQAQADVSEQEAKLKNLSDQNTVIQDQLLANKNLIIEKENKLDSLSLEIINKQKTLDMQNNTILSQETEIVSTNNEVIEKTQTIFALRNVIFVLMFFLLFFLLFIIARQRKAIKNEHELTLTKNLLLESNKETIEALESSSKLKNDFLLAISHEMRTPMNGIVGATQTINPYSPDEVTDGLRMIDHCSSSMLDIVDKVLTYSDILSGTLINTPSPYNIQKELPKLIAHFESFYQNQYSNFAIHLSKLPEHIILDHKKLHRILTQLIDNAVKFSNNGIIELSVAFDSSKPQLHISITDNGPGIDSAIESIFTPFWQAEAGLTRRYSGLGIGLTIAKALTDAMGGQLLAQNRPQGGSLFTLELPCSIFIEQIQTSNNNRTTKPVLIVEDNIINQQVLQLMLKKLGHDVLIAQDGIDALHILETHKPCLILMDLQMPNMDGISCTRKIRQRKDDKREIPIIAITANLIESQHQACINAGMNEYLSKPIELTRLQSTLDFYLHK